MSALKQIERTLAEMLYDMPEQIGMLAVNFSKQRFVEQNWLYTSPQPWKERKRKRRGGKARQNGAVLVDSGRLKRSIRIISTTPLSVTIGTDVPYAQIHNDGFSGVQSVKAHTRKGKNVRAHRRKMKMPKRKFIGNSAALMLEIEKFIMEQINGVLK
ncbi:MAG: phage virion morphogenesis protein [Bacteroidales bacterium]|nr:phage virion morphogenesis protein [Bacteroidales bacterium]